MKMSARTHGHARTCYNTVRANFPRGHVRAVRCPPTTLETTEIFTQQNHRSTEPQDSLMSSNVFRVIHRKYGSKE